MPGRKALGLSTLVGGKLVLVERKALEQSRQACCRSVSGSSCHIGCGGLKMEPGILGMLEHGKLELAGKMERMLVAGSLGLVVAGNVVLVAHIRRCRLDRTG